MKKSLNIRHSVLLPALLLLMGAAASCNSKSDPESEEVAVTASTVAVNGFSLKADKNVAPSLDSVFFSIDLNNAVIFNADSLPKGADISKLVPVITFASTMSKAELAVVDEKGDTLKTVDYLKTTTDSIDFSKKVVLNVTSLDRLNSIEYRLKVNVHQLNPDSIGWQKLDVAPLPSRLSSPLRSKTVVKGGTPYALVEESDNSFTLAEGVDVPAGNWANTPLSLPFTPDVESLTASDSDFFILSDEGNLYSSADGLSWTSIASGWQSIIGPYDSDTILGIKEENGEWKHVEYTAGTESVGNTIPSDFPVRNRTAFVSFSNKWAEQPTGFFVGGTLRDGTVSDKTWAYDGSSWTTISNNLPQLEGAGIVKYTMFRTSVSGMRVRDFDAWLLIGGFLADGSLNRRVIFSFDNGVTWKTANESMDLPAAYPEVMNADAFVINEKRSADLENAWKSVADNTTRASYEIEGTEIIWEAPYIFLSGGYSASGSLSDAIWRGVLMRLNFTPVI